MICCSVSNAAKIEEDRYRGVKINVMKRKNGGCVRGVRLKEREQ